MEQLPARPRKEPDEEPVDAEVVDAEIVGAPPPAPRWRRLLARAVVSALLGLLGLGLLAAGALLTLTIIGAAIGIPLMLVGVVLIAVSALLLFGGGRIVVMKPPFR